MYISKTVDCNMHTYTHTHTHTYTYGFKRQSAYCLTGSVYCYSNHKPLQLCDENPGSFSRVNMYMVSLRNYTVSLNNTWVQIMTFIFLVINHTFTVLYKCFQFSLFFDNDTQTHIHTYKAFKFSFL